MSTQISLHGPRLKGNLRSILKLAEPLGFTFAGYSGSGKPRLRHENGAVITIASTPGDRRNQANLRAMLRRLASAA